MDYKIVNIEPLSCSGITTQLTTSQDMNFNIIRKHWQKFNRLLKVNRVFQGKEWTKYGLTRKADGEYFYDSVVPFNGKFDNFVNICISGGSYCRFTHTGNMELIKSTILQIYKKIIPTSEFTLNENRELIHYEQYDYRFNWNSPDSFIDIYVPVDSNT